MGPYADLAEGMKVKCTGRILEVPVGRGLLGRVVNTLGAPIDGKGPIENDGFSPVEAIAPGVIERQSVDQPVQTGYKSADAMIPIGRGQRSWVTVTVRPVKPRWRSMRSSTNRDSGIKCVTWLSARKASSPSLTWCANWKSTAHWPTPSWWWGDRFRILAALQYLPAPYAGCAMGEYFRDRGEDALIVYDDSSKQAVAARQISCCFVVRQVVKLFPGDVFYLHSRLLERVQRALTPNMLKPSPKVKLKSQTISPAFPRDRCPGGDVLAPDLADKIHYRDRDPLNPPCQPNIVRQLTRVFLHPVLAAPRRPRS